MKFVIPVSRNDLIISKIAIKSIKAIEHDPEIIIITSSVNFDNFSEIDVTIYDEDKLIPGLSYKLIESILFELTNSNARTGWYFQQFLKMAYSLVSDGPYVIWDADTVMLNKIDFIEEDKYVLFFNPIKEHLAYLQTIHKLFPHLRVNQKKSFIVEKMIVDPIFMGKLIHSIESEFKRPFYEIILDNISKKDILSSGFSEFTTYANYSMQYYPEKFKVLKSSHFRDGTIFYGKHPKLDELDAVSGRFDSISFEKWQNQITINPFLIGIFLFFFQIKFIRFILVKFSKSLKS